MAQRDVRNTRGCIMEAAAATMSTAAPEAEITAEFEAVPSKCFNSKRREKSEKGLTAMRECVIL